MRNNVTFSFKILGYIWILTTLNLSHKMNSEVFAVNRVFSAPQRARSMNSVPLVSSEHVYEIPTKLIKTPADMKIWEKSEAYFEYMGFILAINEAIKGKSNTKGSQKASENVLKIVNLLNKLDQKIDEIPPVQQPQRFGNVAFRTWYQKTKDDLLLLLQEVLTQDLYKSIPEIATYLVDAFGNATRIDYGTGHEISFIMFLCCLFKIGLLKTSDKIAAGCAIFPRYLDVVRKLQKTYRMEPAGSHGVWSLDDYQFVPFIWGSSQLVAHPTIEPAGFLEPRILNDFGEDYMFLTCIKYINSVKSGPFAEHSNQLWSISGVSSWSKINGGLIKMYKAEVLSKFPVVQHIVFGSLFTLKPMEQVGGMMTAKTSLTMPPTFSNEPSSASQTTSTQESSHSSVENPLLITKTSMPQLGVRKDFSSDSLESSQETDDRSNISKEGSSGNSESRTDVSVKSGDMPPPMSKAEAASEESVPDKESHLVRVSIMERNEDDDGRESTRRTVKTSVLDPREQGSN